MANEIVLKAGSKEAKLFKAATENAKYRVRHNAKRILKIQWADAQGYEPSDTEIDAYLKRK